MKKLNLTEQEQTALVEAWQEQLPEENAINQFAERKILSSGNRSQVQKFYQLLIMKHNAEQKQWREWIINSGIIKWLVLCEADRGLKGLAKRVNAEWGELAKEYNLHQQFNQAYKDVVNEYK